MREAGAVSILAAAGIGLTMLLGMAVVGATSLVLARAMAQTAADAAALAAAPVTFDTFGTERTPTEEAAFFAAANGARLLECDCAPDPVWRARVVTVTVVVDTGWIPAPFDDVTAIAAAEFDPTVWLEPSGSPGR